MGFPSRGRSTRLFLGLVPESLECGSQPRPSQVQLEDTSQGNQGATEKAHAADHTGKLRNVVGNDTVEGIVRVERHDDTESQIDGQVDD